MFNFKNQVNFKWYRWYRRLNYMLGTHNVPISSRDCSSALHMSEGSTCGVKRTSAVNILYVFHRRGHWSETGPESGCTGLDISICKLQACKTGMGFGQTISWHQACMNGRSVSCTEVTVPIL